MSVLPPYRYGQASQIQGHSRLMSESELGSGSWSRSVSVSWSVSMFRLGSMSGSMSWSRSMSSFCGHGPDGGPPLSPLDYLL